MRLQRHLGVICMVILCICTMFLVSFLNLPGPYDPRLDRTFSEYGPAMFENSDEMQLKKRGFSKKSKVFNQPAVHTNKPINYSKTSSSLFNYVRPVNASVLMRIHTLHKRYSKGENINGAADSLFTQLFPIAENPLVNRFHSESSLVWPGSLNFTWDRIVPQLNYVPSHRVKQQTQTALKTILVLSGLEHGTPTGQGLFQQENCPVNTCYLKGFYEREMGDLEEADAVIFEFDHGREWWRPRDQIWILHMLESPMHTTSLLGMGNGINWTATYRSDSTLVTPYDKFVQFSNVTSLPVRADKNYANGKRKLVAWFVSNCKTRNGRKKYVEELSRYIPVDIYGYCGNLTCSRMDDSKCFAMLKTDYMFYLSFENSNCQYYITEKLFVNALRNDIVPVVMGARKQDYTQVAPPESFIHVEDFRSAEELANYLHKVASSDHLYNQYFRWKGTGSFISTNYWCRLCALLHDDSHVTWYDDVEKWWRGNGTCTLDRWDNPDDLVHNFQPYIDPNL